MISKKLSNITPSYTIGISNKVSELKRQGIDVISLSIGEPDFDVPLKAKEEGIKAIQNNKSKYDLVAGLRELRETIVSKLKNENNCNYDIDEIVVSNGAKHAITNTLMATLDYGDEVLVPKPYWVSYPEMIKLVGANPIFIDTCRDNDYKVSREDILNNLTDKTKMIIICNPSNPSGVVYSKDELEDIVNTCIEKNIYILADEIYERICYVDNYVSIASLSEKAKDITITINGLSKSAAMTGIRLGYSASNKTIAKAISTIQGHLVSHPCNIAQWEGYGALKFCSDDVKEMVKIYKEKRDLAISILDSINELSYLTPNGAFYMFIDISKLKTKLPHTESLSIEFCNRLLNEKKVAIVPGIAFGMDDFVRISYACSKDDISIGISKIKEFINSI